MSKFYKTYEIDGRTFTLEQFGEKYRLTVDEHDGTPLMFRFDRLDSALLEICSYSEICE